MFVFMSAMLWFAIFTTAASGILGIVTRIQDYFQQPMWLHVCLTLATMIPLTALGFSTLIEYLYPIYGILNLYVLTRLLFFPIWNKIDNKKAS